MSLQDFFQNIWTITILGGAGATILATLILRILIKKRRSGQNNSNSQKTTIINKALD